MRRFAARYLPRLRRRYRPKLVVVFGSRAGEEASDLDLLVVSERFQGIPFVQRAATLLADLDLALPVDLLCDCSRRSARSR